MARRGGTPQTKIYYLRTDKVNNIERDQFYEHIYSYLGRASIYFIHKDRYLATVWCSTQRAPAV